MSGTESIFLQDIARVWSAEEAKSGEDSGRVGVKEPQHGKCKTESGEEG